MTLRNAFGEVALESTLKDLKDGYGMSNQARNVMDGKFYLVGKPITLSGVLSGTSRAVLQLWNPSSTGRLAILVGLNVYSTVAQQVQYLEDAVMQGTIEGVVPTNVNRAMASKQSLMQAYWSTTAPTGGGVWPNESRVSPTESLQLSLPPVVLPPGKSFTLFGASSEAHTMTANLYYIEEPIV